MWDRFCIQTFCRHFVHMNFDVQKVYIHNHYVDNLYTKSIQNVYTNNCMHNGSLVSTYFDSFVVHFLVNHCKN